MRNCSKCGLPLAFKTLPSGKLCPTNPDGSDHWDICRATRLASMSQAERTVDRRDAEAMRPVITGGHLTNLYSGTIPPWDESL